MSRMLTALLTVATVCLPLTLADGVFHSSLLYDWGFYGLYPRTWHKSFKQPSPLLNFHAWDDRCDDGHYLFSPRGSIVSKPGPVIVDAKGNLVWISDIFGETTDVKVQTYKGKEYLTFWAGIDGVRYRYGYGTYYMLDETYQVFKAIEPVGENLRGDLHEFKISNEDTALFTVYHTMPMDLSSIGGPEKGWIIDNLFQEVDIETGKLIFEWRASDHVPIDTTMLTIAEDTAKTQGDASDYFHINSVDKDSDGNYLISARHTHSVMCIDPSGNTLWVLGGKDNMFEDLSDGRATDFIWQHHARILGNSTLSIFDNGKSEGSDRVAEYSRGMIIELDSELKTARLVQEFADPKHSRLAQSQGAAQYLDHSGNMLVSYGFLPIFTEFDEDGEVLCDVHIAPRLISHLGMVTSYRAFKSTKWVGRPIQPPAIFLSPSEGHLYASWHGATEIDRWVLEGADWDGVEQGNFTPIIDKKKDTFEVSFAIKDTMPPYVRAAALDRNSEVLGHTEVIHRATGNAPSTKVRGVLVGVGIFLVLMLVIIVLRKRLRRALKSRLASRLVGPIVRGAWWWDRRAANPYEVQPLYKS